MLFLVRGLYLFPNHVETLFEATKVCFLSSCLDCPLNLKGYQSQGPDKVDEVTSRWKSLTEFYPIRKCLPGSPKLLCDVIWHSEVVLYSGEGLYIMTTEKPHGGLHVVLGQPYKNVHNFNIKV